MQFYRKKQKMHALAVANKTETITHNNQNTLDCSQSLITVTIHMLILQIHMWAHFNPTVVWCPQHCFITPRSRNIWQARKDLQGIGMCQRTILKCQFSKIDKTFWSFDFVNQSNVSICCFGLGRIEDPILKEICKLSDLCWQTGHHQEKFTLMPQCFSSVVCPKAEHLLRCSSSKQMCPITIEMMTFK